MWAPDSKPWLALICMLDGPLSIYHECYASVSKRPWRLFCAAVKGLQKLRCSLRCSVSRLKCRQFSMCSCITKKWTFDAFSSFLTFFFSSFPLKLSTDFFKGKTVFNHWLPGICYSNITFQLVSEATFNKSTLVEYSGIQHEPKQHRTGEENYYAPFAPSLYACSPFCCGEGIDPTERIPHSSVWEQSWELLLPRSMGGGC